MMYRIYRIPKKKGFRIITEPLDSLKEVQLYLKGHLDKIQIHPAAHGFVSGRSPITNALPHREKDYILNLDVKNFFPSVKQEALMATLRKQWDQPDYMYQWVNYCCFLNGGLPQGACTSPTLSNIFLIEFDVKMSSYADKHKLSYTRYADDITLSGSSYLKEAQKEVIKSIERTLGDFGLSLNRRKIKLTQYSQCQRVTGIVVNNEKLTIPGRQRRKLYLDLRGTRKQDLDESTLGYLEYIRSVDEGFYNKLCKIMI